MTKDIRISEIFGPTIQGEGALIGQPTVFVRTGGCDYRCTWCDSLHAVDPTYRHDWEALSAEVIFEKIKTLSSGNPLTVTLSGGNPAIQPLGDLIKLGQEAGYQFALETQGSISQDWFGDLNMLVLSPKPPSSGEQVKWDMFDECIARAGRATKVVMKIVIFNDRDYAWARDTADRYPALPLYLQTGNHTPPHPEDDDDDDIDIDAINERTRWLVDKALSDQWFNVHILPQLHVLIWGNKRGV
ncbi:MAG: 7-carboxy-7-deazaguanine synthase QueE [Hyphomicrobiales bacterium]